MQLSTRVSPAVRAGRAVLLVAAVAGLLLGMWAGLIRLGWPWPPLAPVLPMLHGPLMACGFLGVLIGVERAVGTGKRWAYLGPALVAFGVLLALVGAPGKLGSLLVTLGSAVVALVLFGLVKLHPANYTVTMAAGGVAWVVGNLLWWLGWPLSVAALWWIGFLVLTIAGERLELSRMLKLSPTVQRLFAAGALLLCGGFFLGLVNYTAGTAVTGVALIGLAVWLAAYDIARRRLKAGGQARFMAAALLSGYVWLGVGGALLLWHPGQMAGPYYDAALHSIFLGFVFSMIFAHAPIVFPAVLGIPMVYSNRFYAPLVLLQLSLLLRVVGDLAGWWQARLWGGLLNAVVLLAFLVITMSALRPHALWVHRRAEPMPPITRLFIKASLLYLVAALLVGLLLALRATLDLPAIVGGLAPVYFHLFMVGWVTQIIAGVAYWMFPQVEQTTARGYDALALATFWLLNVGLLLRVVAEPAQTVSAWPGWGWLIVAAALLQWLAGMTFVVNTWPRVKDK